MAFETISYEIGAGGIATITLERPEVLNAINPLMERELVEVFDLVDGDDDVRAVVVTGRGRAFCAGADLSGEGAGFDVVRRAQLRGTEEVRPGDVPRDGGGMITMRIFECLKPVIGAINGVGVGAGATIPLAMDIRLAAKGSRFGIVFSRRGMCLDAAASWFLPRAVGMSTALEWAYSGRLVGDEEALRAGLVRSLHPPDELLGAAHALARELTEHSAPVSLAINRQLLWQLSAARHPMEAHRMESIYIRHRAAQGDAGEGARSFLEKRRAAFSDRVSRDLPEPFPAWRRPPFDRRRNDPRP